MTLKINILTSKPTYFIYFFINKLILKLINEKKIILNLIDIKDVVKNKTCRIKELERHSFGGGGLVLGFETFFQCLKKNNLINNNNNINLLPCLDGVELNQKNMFELSKKNEITFLCGRYEGIDYRIRKYINIEFKISNFVLNSSEIAVMSVIDSILRYFYVNNDNLTHESFFNNKMMLDYNHYTSPRITSDQQIIDPILLSGHQKKIEEFRNIEKIIKSIVRLDKIDVNNNEKKILKKNSNKN